MPRKIDMNPFINVLPYDSELYGVYQPLLGWKSRRIVSRIDAGLWADIKNAQNQLPQKFQPILELERNDDSIPVIAHIEPAKINTNPDTNKSTFVMQEIAAKLPPLQEYTSEIWKQILSPEALDKTLNEQVGPKWINIMTADPNFIEWAQDDFAKFKAQIARESLAAGRLAQLAEKNQHDRLKEIFYPPDERLKSIQQAAESVNPMDILNPFKALQDVVLSPIGIVHLYRQYFFELDTFLGTPTGHVWLSPGATVELVEISTRKTLTDRTTEMEFETTTKSEKSVTEEEELSEAVKEDNKSDTSFGMNATANQGWIGGSATASSTMDMNDTQTAARENANKHMRSQSEKLSTEIRKNYKSTFKTVTETTDTSSKRYVVTNNTRKLINYELRRKMRRVGVQVQDVGTYLCWQTYVDDPGRQLGLPELIHIAKDPEIGHIAPPEATPMPQSVESKVTIDIPFIQTSKGRGDLDEGYRDGFEVDKDTNEGDKESILSDFDGLVAICPQSGYKYVASTFDYKGNDIQLALKMIDESVEGKITFGIKVHYVNFRGRSPLRVILKIVWEPTDVLLQSIKTQNDAKLNTFTEQTRREFEKAYVAAAEDRVKAASKVPTRPFHDLREEERIVVYRALIQDMLTKGIEMPDDRTRHVVSELLNSIFDIDKMLYFVAPEWWRPRLHQSRQDLGDAPHSTAAVAGQTGGVDMGQALGKTSVSWGGSEGGRDDNYYIAQDADPARMGSSLGWLLQLDGDKMRNAFLNAPWVKAVIPVRPGKERAAMNWLSQVDVEGTDGLNADYLAPQEQLDQIPTQNVTPSILDAVNHLCDLVAAKHSDALTVKRFPPEEEHDDNKVSSTPVDRVYEHGFYPLQGGFKLGVSENFEIFDQWTEILPTDQIVPVEVDYDPKTGRLI